MEKKIWEWFQLCPGSEEWHGHKLNSLNGKQQCAQSRVQNRTQIYFWWTVCCNWLGVMSRITIDKISNICRINLIQIGSIFSEILKCKTSWEEVESNYFEKWSSRKKFALMTLKFKNSKTRNFGFVWILWHRKSWAIPHMNLFAGYCCSYSIRKFLI